jgi:hypothetical protein
MVSTELHPVSHAASAGALRSRAPDGGTDRAPLAAASDAIGPAVVNHVKGPGASDDSDQEEIRKMQARDSEVRAHERAHATAGGALAGAPSFQFERGPDGRSYAVGGEVSIDVSEVSDDADATVRKMQQVKRAALAPQNPSDADRAIAAMADAKIAAARLELTNTDSQEPSDEKSSTQVGDAAHTAFGSNEQRNAAVAAYHNASARGSNNSLNVVS